MKGRALGPEKVRVYWEKSQRFAASAHAAARAGHWDPAVSAAVHAAINGVDALSIARLGRRSSSDSHADAVDLLDAMESDPAATRAEIAKHFRALLAVKHLAEYEARLCDANDGNRAVRHMDRALDQVEKLLGEARSKRA